MGSWRTRRSCGSASWHVRARMRRTLVMPALRVLASGSVCRSTLRPLFDESCARCLRPLDADCVTTPAVADRPAPTTTDAAGGINQRNGLGFTGGECDSAPRPLSGPVPRAARSASARRFIAPPHRPVPAAQSRRSNLNPRTGLKKRPSIGPDPPPRTAERRGPASRSRHGRAGESAAGGRAGGGDAVPCQMFHVRCAWDVGHEAAAGRAEGGWEHGWGRVERLPERCPSKKLQACTIKAQDDGLRHFK